MKVNVIVILIILLLGFFASRLRFDEPVTTSTPPSSQTSLISTPKNSSPAQEQIPKSSPAIASANTMFNLDGEWRGVLQPLHGSHLDPRNWNLELKFFISAGTAKVYILRGTQWQEVKTGRFKYSQNKTNAILYSIDSGGSWVESWIFSITRYDADNINVYGNRTINNFKQAAGTPSRITYGATSQFKRVYEQTSKKTEKNSSSLSDDDIASQIEQAVQRGKHSSSHSIPGKLRIFEQLITHETDDSAVLQVKYQYDGAHTDNAWISAITHNNGKSTGHWSFRPVKLQRGKRAAQIRIGMSSASPDKYCSDSFIIQAYVPNDGNFFEKTMPYKRCWSKK